MITDGLLRRTIDSALSAGIDGNESLDRSGAFRCLRRIFPRSLFSAIAVLVMHWCLCDCAVANDRIATHTQASTCTHSIRITGHDRYPNRDFLSMPEVFSGLMETPATHELIVKLVQPLKEFFKVEDVAQNVHVIFDSDYTAFSTMDNNVYLTLGVLQKAQSDEEVMAVIAHELGHLRCGHPNIYETTQRAKWMALAGIFGFGAIGMQVTSGSRVIIRGSQVSATGRGVGQIGSLQLSGTAIKYARAGRSRDQELSADRIAVDALMATKGTAAGVHAFLAHIANPDVDTGKVSALEGADHPDATDRLEHLRDYERSMYPNPSDPRPFQHPLLEKWQAEDAAFIAAVSRVESAARLVGAPYALIANSDAITTLTRNANARAPVSEAQARALLSDAYSQLAPEIGANGAALSNLKEMWLPQWINAELEARRKLLAYQDITEESKTLSSVLKDPHTPEWFTYVCSLIAAKVNRYADADSILSSARAQYSDLSPLYPLHIAVIAKQEASPLRAAAMFSLVTACGIALDSDLNAACKLGLNNPRGYIDQQWNKHHALLAETSSQMH